jgi:pyruvate,water dikinase
VSVPFRYASVNGWYYNCLPTPSPRLLLRVLLESRGRAPWVLFNALARVSSNPAAADRAVLHKLEIHWREKVLPEYREFVDAAEHDVDTAAIERAVEIVDGVCRLAGRYLFSLAVVGGSAWKMEGALARFWEKHLAGALSGTPTGAAGHQSLLRGLPGAEPTFPPHAVYSLDWYQPTAGESTDGRPVPADVAPPRATELAESRVAAEQRCRTVLANRPRLLARFDALLAVVQRYSVIREEQARDFTLGWPLLRRAARRLGELLKAADVIDTSEDVFFLPLGALGAVVPKTAGVDYRDDIRENRAAWERQRRLPAPLTLGTPGRIGDPISRAVVAARGGRPVPDGAIVGQPASAGHVTGRVRVISGPEDFADFRAGEILVASSTAPAWTVLFARAAAVVTDGGTLAAHASLVAREYGIPAVVGTGTATTRLHTGQLVAVDGYAGTVLPLEQG